MIEQADINRVGGFTELSSDLNIRRAGRWIAAGMIMHAKDRGSAVADRFPKHLARVGEATSGGARGDFYLFNQAVLAVEAKDPEFFDA